MEQTYRPTKYLGNDHIKLVETQKRLTKPPKNENRHRTEIKQCVYKSLDSVYVIFAWRSEIKREIWAKMQVL
jgi:hypothetical protein